MTFHMCCVCSRSFRISTTEWARYTTDSSCPPSALTDATANLAPSTTASCARPVKTGSAERDGRSTEHTGSAEPTCHHCVPVLSKTFAILFSRIFRSFCCCYGDFFCMNKECCWRFVLVICFDWYIFLHVYPML